MKKDPYRVLLHPTNTEKAVRLIEKENKLLFTVSLRATKNDIKQAVEDAFKVKVVKVNTLITNRGEKRAYITLSRQHPAMDIVTKLGLI